MAMSKRGRRTDRHAQDQQRPCVRLCTVSASALGKFSLLSWHGPRASVHQRIVHVTAATMNSGQPDHLKG